MKIVYSPTFIRRYKKLPAEIKPLAEAREAIFRKNPREVSLSTHKLHGKLKGLWSFSVNASFRIVFEFAESSSVIFHSIGDHDEVY